jgi:uncharacterized membrane protein
MSDIIDGKPTMTFWFLSGAALIWNLFGMMIYVMTVSATPEQLAAQYTAEQVAFLENVPVWATSAFAIAVTAGVLGSLMLLFRKAWAVPLFVVSLVAVLVQNLHSFVLNDSIALFGMTPVYIQSAIVVIAVLLIFFSRGAKARRWLT